MPERQFGPYALVRQIAVGGMAEIHLAKTSGIAGFEKYAALKMIHPNFSQDQQFIEMLIDEAKITVQLQHVNIAQTFDLGRVGDTYYITMEYVDGADLYKLLRRGSEKDKDVPVPVCAHIAKEIATGLDYAHRKRDVSGRPLGIVHRDVSPQNVLISYAGETKLVDFGIAKATMRVRQTAVGVIKGKYYYMSPEQAWGDPLDHRTDIFSTGILLYEMLTGQMLYLEEDLHRLLDMVRKADIPPPTTLRKDIPPQLERIVMHALQKKPADRYQTAGDLASDLERFLHTYAPVFTATKVAAWVLDVLGPEDAPPAVTGRPAVPDVRRETKRLTREQLAQGRQDITDENSVIFNVADLMRDAGEGVDDPTLDRTTPPAPAAAPAPAPARPPSPAKPPPPPIGPGAVRPLPPPRAPAGKGRPALAPLPPAPKPKMPLVPRQMNAATQQIPDMDAATSTADAPAGGLPAVPSLGHMDDSTVVSGPPGFGARFDMGDDPPYGDGDPTMADGATLIQSPLFSGIDATADDDDDDEDAADHTMPDPAHGRRFPRDIDDPPSEISETDATNVAVRAAPADDDDDDGWEKAPQLAASNPVPAVSAIRRPRQSRRTPPSGTQPPPGTADDTTADGRGRGSVLSSLLGREAGVPQVAMSSPTTSSSRSTPSGGSGSIKPGPFPAPSPIGGLPPLPLSPTTDRTPSTYGVLPAGAPPTMTKQLAAIELEEIPDRYKIGHRRRTYLLWAGIVLLGLLVGGALVAFSVGDDKPRPVPGTIEIVSHPDGATVTIDGKKLPSLTPTLYRGAKPGGRYLIVVDLPGYQKWESEERIPAEGGNRSVVARLDKIVVSLRVDSEPPGASVLLNNIPMGRTPLVLPEIDPATATTLELRKRGYRPLRRNLDWSTETEKELRLLLER